MRSTAEQAVAEVIGTLGLVFVGAGAVVIASSASSGAGDGLLGVALAHALVLAVLVSSFGHISGGHFNPAVTISVWVAGKIETARAGVYILSQLVGATAGAGLLRWVMPEQLWRNAHLGATLVSGISDGRAVLLEAILTFFLVITIFAVAIDDRGVFKSVAGLPIGLVLGFDILVGGPLTGASMNPARSFGPALVGGTWTNFWVYVVGPVIGGLIAASVYTFVFLREREVVAPRTETPIGGGPEEDLP
jgi:MIP family channel proteins